MRARDGKPVGREWLRDWVQTGRALRIGRDAELDTAACRAAETAFQAAVEPWDPYARGWPRRIVAADDVAVGLLATMPSTGAHYVYLVWEARNLGVGDLLLEMIDTAGDRLAVPMASSDLAYPLARAFQPSEHHGAWIILDPPSRRTDLRPAASVTLVAGGRVLLGLRRVAPWAGHWAFPGGRVEPGETTEAAALRELSEECGIHLAPAVPDAHSVVAVSSPTGDRAFAIENFVFRLDAPLTAQASQEMVPEWVDLEEAISRRPMAAGSRRILRRLMAERTTHAVNVMSPPSPLGRGVGGADPTEPRS